jgi:hypothetical protein
MKILMLHDLVEEGEFTKCPAVKIPQLTYRISG